MRDRQRYVFLVLASLAVIALIATSAMAECFITGDITAEENIDNPDLGDWCYTLEVAWDSDGPYALSHFDLLIDTEASECSCGEIADALVWEDPAGSSDGVPDDCTVDYMAFIECDGDPSIPGVEGILLKFEYYEDEECGPGPSGMGTFVFYSDFAPAQVDEDNEFMVFKFAGDSCTGPLTGVFPAIDCDPVSGERASWSHVKDSYK